MTPRRVVSVRWDKALEVWVVLDGKQPNPARDCNHRSKVRAVACAREVAKGIADAGDRAQLAIFGKNGRIQTEHTYPRSSDPQRSKG